MKSWFDGEYTWDVLVQENGFIMIQREGSIGILYDIAHKQCNTFTWSVDYRCNKCNKKAPLNLTLKLDFIMKCL